MQITQHAGEMPNIRNDILVSPGVYSTASCILRVTRVPQSEAFTSRKWCPRLPCDTGVIYIYIFISVVCGLRSPLHLVDAPCCRLLCDFRAPEIKPKNVNQRLAKVCPSVSVCMCACIYIYIYTYRYTYVYTYIYILRTI